MARLIIVDDDPVICSMLADHLGPVAGHEVRSTGDGAGLDRLMREQQADAVLLDIGLPVESGIGIALRLRQHENLAIIMLTGADELLDRVVGLEAGADDYITKPFSLPEVTARIEAVLRRRGTRGSSRIAFGPLTLDRASWSILDGEGKQLALSPTEIDLIAAFALHPNKVLYRDNLLALAPAHGQDPEDRSIDTRVLRLRRKLEKLTGRDDLIRTARGAGYLHLTSSPGDI